MAGAQMVTLSFAPSLRFFFTSLCLSLCVYGCVRACVSDSKCSYTSQGWLKQQMKQWRSSCQNMQKETLGVSAHGPTVSSFAIIGLHRSITLTFLILSAISSTAVCPCPWFLSKNVWIGYYYMYWKLSCLSFGIYKGTVRMMMEWRTGALLVLLTITLLSFLPIRTMQSQLDLRNVSESLFKCS